MSLPPLTPPSRRRGLQIDSLLFFDTPSAMMQGKNRLFRRVDPARRGRPFCYPPSEGLGEVVCPNNNEQPAAHTSPNSRADRLLPSFGGAGGGGLPLQLATKHSSLLIPFLPFKPFKPFLSPLRSAIMQGFNPCPLAPHLHKAFVPFNPFSPL